MYDSWYAVYRTKVSKKCWVENKITGSHPILPFSKFIKIFSRYFDPEKVFLDNENKQFSGWANRHFGWKGSTDRTSERRVSSWSRAPSRSLVSIAFSVFQERVPFSKDCSTSASCLDSSETWTLWIYVWYRADVTHVVYSGSFTADTSLSSQKRHPKKYVFLVSAKMFSGSKYHKKKYLVLKIEALVV